MEYFKKIRKFYDVESADALNKGLISGKSNPLKRSFVDKLASLGFSNPAVKFYA